jgi:hypothetical protein
MMAQSLRVADILTTKEIKQAIGLWKTKESTQQFHRALKREVLGSAMPRINERLGQENSIDYLAYAVQYAMMVADKKGGGKR